MSVRRDWRPGAWHRSRSRSPQRRRRAAVAAADVQHVPVVVVQHPADGGLAGDPLRGRRADRRPVLQVAARRIRGMPGRAAVRARLRLCARLCLRAGAGGQRFGSDVDDDLVDVGVGGAGDLPGQEVPGDVDQRAGQASGRLLLGGVVAGAGRAGGGLVFMQAVRMLGVPGRRAQRLQHDRAVGGRQPDGHRQRPVIVDPERAPARDDGVLVIRAGDPAVRGGEPLQLARRSPARPARPVPPRSARWRSGSAPAPSHTTSARRRTHR